MSNDNPIYIKLTNNFNTFSTHVHRFNWLSVKAGMRGMIGTRGIMVGTREIKVGMRGIGVGMLRMRGIRGSQGGNGRNGGGNAGNQSENAGNRMV